MRAEQLARPASVRPPRNGERRQNRPSSKRALPEHAPAAPLPTSTGPTGTVTFLFTDIEGSTRLLRELGDEAYGEIEYSYGGRSAKTRSTSHREVLPLLYELAAKPIPTPLAGDEYPGYPLTAGGQLTLPWFFGALPLLIVIAWWRSRRTPRSPRQLIEDGGRS
jgi:hypothetical protein